MVLCPLQHFNDVLINPLIIGELVGAGKGCCNVTTVGDSIVVQ